MKLIKPSKISGEIFKIIVEADEKLVLVSPYINITGWPKLTTRLKSVIKRGIDVKAYVRDGQNNLNSINELQKIGIIPRLIPNLHAKIYFNEKDAVTTSMNLLKSSDQFSLEIGHTAETKEEYDDIVNYYTRYILPFEKNLSNFNTILEDEIDFRLRNMYPKLKMYSNFNSLKINTGQNQFEVNISKQSNGHFLEIITILSGMQYTLRDKLLSDFDFPEKFGIEFIEGGNGSYDMVIGYFDREINSKRISDVLNSEKSMIADLVCAFVENIESFKLSIR